MLDTLRRITLAFLLALVLVPAAALAEDEDPELLAACSQALSISIQTTEATQIVVRYNETAPVRNGPRSWFGGRAAVPGSRSASTPAITRAGAPSRTPRSNPNRSIATRPRTARAE